MPNNLHPAKQYIEDVLSGAVVTGHFVQLAVKRHQRDLIHGHERGLYFDEIEAQYAIDFAKLCRHSKGEWAGSIVELEPWQQFIVWCIFGWKRADGTRRYRKAYIEVGRKNGKSTLLSIIGLYMFVADGEGGADVYSVATDRDQARIIHGESMRMVKSSPSLLRKIKIYRDNLNIEATNSKYEPLPRDVSHGLNIYAAMVDELHEHKTRDTWDVVTTSTGSRRQPLILAITTAGFDRNSICYQERDYIRRILLEQIEVDSAFGIIYCLDTRYDWPELEVRPADGEWVNPDIQYEDDYREESCWIKANPNLGVSKYLDYMKEQVAEAQNIPSSLNGILRLDFDVWTQSSIRWISPIKWAACSFEVDEEALRGRRCFGGLDLSSSIDISAFVLVFPPEKEGEKYIILPRFFIPKDNMLERIRRDRVPYDVWYRDGLIIPTPGNVIDYDYIVAEIEKLADIYSIEEISFDRWGSIDIAKRLQDSGGEDWLVMFGQGFASMSAPMKELERLILSQQLAHGGNPVLSWMADNVMATKDAAENIKPDKAKSIEKIDGIVALIMALGRAMAGGDTGGLCESRGVLYL